MKSCTHFGIAFGDRIGLETDWNSCILLSSTHTGGVSKSTGYIEQHDIKARLPHSVQQVRHHLEHVDDIPLHVSLFAECSPPAITEMIHIFQEYGDIVCAMGSSLNDRNATQFASANIGVSIEPISRQLYRERPENGRMSAVTVSAMLNRLGCSFMMHHDTSLYALNQLIGEARQFQFAHRQVMSMLVDRLTS
jgi:magnesium-transporting ATPase (P-type)